MLYGIKDADLEKDLGIEIRLHRVKILDSIDQIKSGVKGEVRPPFACVKAAANDNVLLKELQKKTVDKEPGVNLKADNKSNADLETEKNKENEGQTPQRVDTEPSEPSLADHLNLAEGDKKDQPIPRIEEEKGVIIQNPKEGKSVVLKVIEGPLINSVFEVTESGTTLGRHSGSNDLVIPQTFVSRKHCQIIHKDGKFYIEDLGSTTGTFVMVKSRTLLKNGMKASAILDRNDISAGDE